MVSPCSAQDEVGDLLGLVDLHIVPSLIERCSSPLGNRVAKFWAIGD
jgi:hypothetical protein